MVGHMHKSIRCTYAQNVMRIYRQRIAIRRTICLLGIFLFACSVCYCLAEHWDILGGWRALSISLSFSLTHINVVLYGYGLYVQYKGTNRAQHSIICFLSFDWSITPLLIIYSWEKCLSHTQRHATPCHNMSSVCHMHACINLIMEYVEQRQHAKCIRKKRRRNGSSWVFRWRLNVIFV